MEQTLTYTLELSDGILAKESNHREAKVYYKNVVFELADGLWIIFP